VVFCGGVLQYVERHANMPYNPDSTLCGMLSQVNEAKRHAPGLSVVVYDGLKWQRSQAEAAARKQQGR
jgi:hypothetical protein